MKFYLVYIKKKKKKGWGDGKSLGNRLLINKLGTTSVGVFFAW